MVEERQSALDRQFAQEAAAYAKEYQARLDAAANCVRPQSKNLHCITD